MLYTISPSAVDCLDLMSSPNKIFKSIFLGHQKKITDCPHTKTHLYLIFIKTIVSVDIHVASASFNNESMLDNFTLCTLKLSVILQSFRLMASYGKSYDIASRNFKGFFCNQ